MAVRHVDLDGLPIHLNMISSREHVVALHQVERDGWEEARLSVQLSVPTQELRAADWSNIICVAVLTERRTNTRALTQLTADPAGDWSGIVTLHRDHHVNAAELTGHVVATVQGIRGRIVGSTQQSWTIDLQARKPVRQKFMIIRHVDFSAAENSHLHPFKEDPWTVETGDDTPIVYLNTRFEGLIRLLEAGDRVIREAVSTQIAADVWTALFNASVYSASTGEKHTIWPGGWKDSVLKRMLPDIFPDLSLDDALDEVVSRRLSSEGGGDLQTRLIHATGRQSARARRLGNYIRSIERKEHA